MAEHPHPDADLDDTDAGYRDSLEEKAYEGQSGWDDPKDEDEDEDEDEED